MIDREAGGGLWSRKKNTVSSADNYQDQGGLSNKTVVYLVIMALIVLLCIVYVNQLRSGKAAGAGPKAADAAATAATAAETPAETASEGAAETPSEGTAETPAEGAAETPAEEAAETPAQ